MSEHYITYGLITKLNTVIEDDYDDFQLKLYKNDESKLGISYDKQLVYFDHYKDYSYEFSIKLISKNFIDNLKKEFDLKMKEYDLQYNKDEIKIFFNHYYSATDNPIDEITLSEFEKM